MFFRVKCYFKKILYGPCANAVCLLFIFCLFVLRKGKSIDLQEEKNISSLMPLTLEQVFL